MNPIGFVFVDAIPRIAVQFRKDKGLRSKNAVAVIVARDGTTEVLGSTGFDAPACGLFNTIYKMGSGFAGNLYKNGKTVGDFIVGKNSRSDATLTVRINGSVNAVSLEDKDVADLKSLFSEVGRSA